MCHINTYTGTHACMTIHMYYTHSSIDYLLNHIHTCRCSAWMHKISSLARIHKYHMHACAHIMIQLYIYVCACMHDVYLHMWHIHEWSWSVVHTCKCTICMHAQALHTIIMHAAQISACVCDALDACIKWWVRLCSPAFWNILQCKLCRWSAKISHYLVTLEHLNVLADHATPGAIVQWWNRSKHEPGRDERALHEMRMASYAALVQLLQQFVSCGATADLQEKGWWQDSKIVDRISEWVMGLETMRELCLVWLKRTSYIYPTTRSCRHAFAHSCRYESNCRPIQL